MQETKNYTLEDIIVVMAKIVQVLTRPGSEYDPTVANSLVRNLDGVIQKLNTTFQEELKQEIEAQAFFID